MKKRINWDYMVSKEYTDERVISEFQQEIIMPTNEKFSKLFNWNKGKWIIVIKNGTKLYINEERFKFAL